MGTKTQRRANDNSESGQSTFIMDFFARRGYGCGTVFDAGANRPDYISNSFLFLAEGWRGLLYEPTDLATFWEPLASSLNFQLVREFIPLMSDGLHNVLSNSLIAPDIDVLFLDIDGGEYGLIEGLFARATVRPKVICVEYNNNFSPEIKYVPNSIVIGLQASARAFFDLFKTNSYVFLGCFWGDIVFADLSFYELAEKYSVEHEEHRFVRSAIQHHCHMQQLIFGENDPNASLTKVDSWIRNIASDGGRESAVHLALYALRTSEQLLRFRAFYGQYRGERFFNDLTSSKEHFERTWSCLL